MNKYEDIINIKHYEPKKHLRMILANRAAQFAPFNALTGYDDAIKETGRETNKKIILSEDEIVVINNKIRIIKENINSKVKVKITYFIADLYKDGGCYITKEGIIKRIDEERKLIIFNNKNVINIGEIIDIELK